MGTRCYREQKAPHAACLQRCAAALADVHGPSPAQRLQRAAHLVLPPLQKQGAAQPLFFPGAGCMPLLSTSPSPQTQQPGGRHRGAWPAMGCPQPAPCQRVKRALQPRQAGFPERSQLEFSYFSSSLLSFTLGVRELLEPEPMIISDGLISTHIIFKPHKPASINYQARSIAPAFIYGKSLQAAVPVFARIIVNSFFNEHVAEAIGLHALDRAEYQDRARTIQQPCL